jgi:hypothetical protein
MGDDEVVDLTADTPVKRKQPSAPGVAAKKAKPAAAAKKLTQGYALLWIPHTCKAGKKVKVLGVFPSKADAETERTRLFEITMRRRGTL